MSIAERARLAENLDDAPEETVSEKSDSEEN